MQLTWMVPVHQLVHLPKIWCAVDIQILEFLWSGNKNLYRNPQFWLSTSHWQVWIIQLQTNGNTTKVSHHQMQCSYQLHNLVNFRQKILKQLNGWAKANKLRKRVVQNARHNMCTHYHYNPWCWYGSAWTEQTQIRLFL